MYCKESEYEIIRKLKSLKDSEELSEGKVLILSLNKYTNFINSSLIVFFGFVFLYNLFESKLHPFFNSFLFSLFFSFFIISMIFIKLTILNINRFKDFKFNYLFLFEEKNTVENINSKLIYTSMMFFAFLFLAIFINLCKLFVSIYIKIDLGLVSHYLDLSIFILLIIIYLILLIDIKNKIKASKKGDYKIFLKNKKIINDIFKKLDSFNDFEYYEMITKELNYKSLNDYFYEQKINIAKKKGFNSLEDYSNAFYEKKINDKIKNMKKNIN